MGEIMKRVSTLLLILSAGVISTSCSDLTRHYHWFTDMHHSPGIDAQQIDERSGRIGNLLPPEGSIAYGESVYEYGVAEADLAAAKLVVPANIDLDEGKKKYDIYCSPCHGVQGYGDGAIKKKWPSIRPLAAKEGKNLPVYSYNIQKFYHVATVGFATMSGYATQTSEEDRWNIAAYIKNVLQK